MYSIFYINKKNILGSSREFVQHVRFTTVQQFYKIRKSGNADTVSLLCLGGGIIVGSYAEIE